MKFLIQRVTSAQVEVEEKVVGQIDAGYLVLVGISNEDNEDIADRMLQKLVNLRIFEDENGKTNLSIGQVGGNVLMISQFTLYADCHKGNRPSFVHAGAPDEAERLYEYLLSRARTFFPDIQHGIFGAMMRVSLVNDGPFTIMLDSEEVLAKHPN